MTSDLSITIKKLRIDVNEEIDKVNRLIGMRENTVNCIDEFLTIIGDDCKNKDILRESVNEMITSVNTAIKTGKTNLLNLCDLYKTYLYDMFPEDIINKMTCVTNGMIKRYKNIYRLTNDDEISLLLFMENLYICEGSYKINFAIDGVKENTNDNYIINAEIIEIKIIGEFNLYNFCKPEEVSIGLKNIYDSKDKITITSNLYIDKSNNYLIIRRGRDNTISTFVFNCNKN